MRRLTVSIVSHAILAAVIGLMPVLLIVDAALNKGWPVSHTIAWVFGCYVMAGLIGMGMSWKTKLPICGSHSVPVAVLLGTALGPFSLEEATGSYLLAGLCMLALGLSGQFDKVVRYIPIEIVMAMFAGTMIRYALGIITIIQEHVWLGVAALAGYLLFFRFFPSVPAPLGAFLLGGIVAFYLGEMDAPAWGTWQLPAPVMPEFSWQGFVSLSIPIVLLVLGTEGIQGFSGLRLGGFRPPVNQMVAVSGIGTMLAALFGGHSANTAGIMTTVCAGPETGPAQERYKAAFLAGVIMLAFGLLASVLIPWIVSLPRYVIHLFNGFALIPVLIGALKISFQQSQYVLSPFVTFVFSMSGMSFFGMHASFWALILGVSLLWLLERKRGERAERS
ncbi:MAG: hypothetical protein A6D91_03375 [Bacillaceae bacterium G1]|nr:MAG: hypothetical protein A6D91_03375 [Bacillaceae bacterium G1]